MSDKYEDDYEITEADLDEIADAIEAADELHQRFAFLATPKIPCPECGGAGQVYGGSLGNICISCEGARMVDHPGAEQHSLPGFAAERAALGAYIRAQRTGVALPPASTLTKPEAIRARTQEVKEASRQLGAAPVVQGQLAAPERKSLGSLGDEDAEFADEDLDELES